MDSDFPRATSDAFMKSLKLCACAKGGHALAPKAATLNEKWSAFGRVFMNSLISLFFTSFEFIDTTMRYLRVDSFGGPCTFEWDPVKI